MRFSWTGLLLAPLPAPMLLSAALVSLTGATSPLLSFLILLVPGCIISFGATLGLFLPFMFVLSMWRPMTMVTVCLLGLVLGTALFVPLTWFAWLSSGDDSGPPTESFFVFFPRWVADPLTMAFPLSGLLTAALYWGLGTWRLRHARSVRGQR